MKKNLLTTLTLISAGVFLHTNVNATPLQRIGVADDYVTTIYALGATDQNRGVYTLKVTEDTPEKISGSTYIEYSFIGSGGTFVDENTVYGTAYKYYSTYGVIAKAEGNENGPWAPTFYNYTDASGYPIAATSVAKDMTYSTVDEKIYGIFRRSSWDTDLCLAIYDGETFKTTKIGDLPDYSVYDAIAADGNGNLYAINGSEGKLVQIDKTTAAVTEVGSLGVIAQAQNQSAAIDATTGKMYWIAAQSTYNPTQALYEVDLATGAATKLYDVESGRYNGIFIPAPKASVKAPASVSDLTASFTGAGTDVKVSFTLPEKNFGGGTLSGEMTYSILCDSEEIATGVGNPGEAVEKTVTVEAGMHKIGVECIQGSLKGPRSTTEVFAGFDTPIEFTGLNAAAEGNSVKLTWNAPGTANGGILNPEALSYTVVRYPGAVEVASALKDCEYTDNVPAGNAAIYSWEVIMKYEGSDDKSCRSNSILLGDAYTVPYTQDFNSLETLGDAAFSQYNDETGNSRPSPEWTLGTDGENKYAELNSQYYFYHKDYLFSAPVKFDKGVTYTLKFKLASSAANPVDKDWSTTPPTETPKPYNLSVFLTKGHSSAEEDRVADSLAENIDFVCTSENVGVFEEQTFKFTVTESGEYAVCLLDESPYTFSNISLRVDDIEITAEYQTPAEVSDFTVETEENNNRNVHLKFTLPSVTAQGEELASLSEVEIYRGSNLLTTLTEGVAPGATMEYVDEMAPRGIHAYKVVAVNHGLKSQPAVSTIRSGYVNNLQITSYELPDFIAENGKAEAWVTVHNDAFEYALDYRVLLMIDGEESLYETGVPLAPDAEETYYFTLPWIADMPEHVKMHFSIEFFGDEYMDDNVCEQKDVTFALSGIDNVNTSDVYVSAFNGLLSVFNAEGLDVTVYDVAGKKVAGTQKASDKYTVALTSGVYLVKAGKHTFKVTL